MGDMAVNKMKVYIVWVNYGSEGWKPFEYQSLDKIGEDLLAMVYPFSGGCPIKITEEIKIQFYKNEKEG